jgi:Xaa-Pro dipeptidase
MAKGGPAVATLSEDEYRERLRRLRMAMERAGLEYVLLSSPANIAYLSGVSITPHERLIGLFVPGEGEPVLVVPTLESEAARENPAALVSAAWDDAEGPFGVLGGVLERAGARSLAIEKDAVTVRVAEALAEVVGSDDFADCSGLLRELRLRKSPAELELLRRAARVLDACLGELPPLLRPGRTEAELAFELQRLLREHESQGTPFEAIVLAGPNAALPHGRPGARALEDGDLVIVDFGSVHEGYCADVARTFAVGEPSEQAREVFEIVREAQEAGREAVRAGTPCRDVDRAARAVIEARGYGEHFVHRTGHGLGLQVHEPPDLAAGSEERLEPGAVVTVEPGIYLPGVTGVRIEDDLAVGEDGHESFTTTRRDLVVCPA